MPTIVAAYRQQGEAWKPWAANIATLDLSDQFGKPGAAGFVRDVLAAPVERGGTLAGIASATGPAANHIGKSGTSQAAKPNRDRGKFAIGAFERGGSQFAYFFMWTGATQQMVSPPVPRDRR